MVGEMKTRQHQRQQAKAQEQQDAALDRKRGAYGRAFSACTEGKGYSVK